MARISRSPDPRISSILQACRLSMARISRCPHLQISSILQACRLSMARISGSPDVQISRSPASLGLPLDGPDPLENRENCQGQHYQLAPCAPFSMVDTRKIFLAIFGLLSPLAWQLLAQPIGSRPDSEASAGPPTSSSPGPDSRRPRPF
ncbi:hypothetical protein CTA1_10630 [Colletotrichum tanaceti]|uniref:Uncharacterized protein n=1 Tax=Colletotrichum tanaceti TaxID=1306861 RepID=A0A4U6XLL5_9PEZI|nr:hypothetical protein CTA1_10630 [Colletotrichum tanaceti]